jgi:hypothetical protein
MSSVSWAEALAFSFPISTVTGYLPALAVADGLMSTESSLLSPALIGMLVSSWVP